MSSIAFSGNAAGAGVFTIASPNSASSFTATLPAATTTLVGTDATQTLTNKTLTSPTLTTPAVNSATITTVSGTAPLYMARAWVCFDGTTASPSTIRGSGNVSSVTKIATGQYNVNLTTAVTDTNYAVNNTVKPNSDRLAGCGEFYNFTRTTSAYGVSTGDNSTYYDASYVSSSMFR